MEGWYYRFTFTGDDDDDNRKLVDSFALIFCIAGPHSYSLNDVTDHNNNNKSPLTLSCAQVIGPGDEYLVQAA